jgi:hypothetical protein
MERITVTQNSDTGKGWSFSVKVEDRDGSTEHAVTLSKGYYEVLKDGRSPEELIEDSFKFLLERESKDKILKVFDISLISTYFPEFDTRIRK